MHQMLKHVTQNHTDDLTTSVVCPRHTVFSNLQLTPWSTVLPKKLTDTQLVKKFSAFYGTRSFITSFTSAGHLSLSWARSIRYMPPHPTYWRSTLILPSHLHLGFPSGVFPSDFPTNILYTLLLSPIRATCPAQPIILIIRIFGEQYRSLNESVTLLILHKNGSASTVTDNFNENLLDCLGDSHIHSFTHSFTNRCLIAAVSN